ncbi:MAG: TRAP transporter permease, partial [Pseudomonadota bacterium]
MAETKPANPDGLVNAEPTLARSDIGPAARTAVVILTVAGIALSVYQLFGFGKYVTTLLQGQYLYLLGGLFLAQVFLCFRMFKTS